MMQIIRKIGDYKTLYRDDKSGIAWIVDNTTGLGYSVHPNIDSSGSVAGMKALGYWSKSDRTIRSHGWIYNIDILAYDKKNELEKLLADSECKCVACIERRGF